LNEFCEKSHLTELVLDITKQEQRSRRRDESKLVDRAHYISIKAAEVLLVFFDFKFTFRWVRSAAVQHQRRIFVVSKKSLTKNLLQVCKSTTEKTQKIHIKKKLRETVERT
jgi:hypothetical protein